MKPLRWISLPLAGIATMAMLSGCGSTAAPTGLSSGLDTTPPPAPAHVFLSHDEMGRPLLAWDASSAPDVASYDVYLYSPDPSRDNAYLLVSTDANNNYLLPSVSTVTTETFRVRSVDGSGNKSAFSAAAIVQVAPGGGGGDHSPIDTP
ncbi:MAG: hypothetical protein HYR74_06855 [Candidatus Eisenbacteria bacterium]|nr:hypothetical protein [Candidatus Eisenbacteria bacterium]